jgi:hypothetical protein
MRGHNLHRPPGDPPRSALAAVLAPSHDCLMPEIKCSLVTPLDPEQVFGAMIDFTDHRPDLWPALDPELYRVHAQGRDWAEVTEGSVGRHSPPILLPNFRKIEDPWARQRYEWSTEDRIVRSTVLESSWINPPGPAEYRVFSHEYGSRIVLSLNQTHKGVIGMLFDLTMMIAGRQMLTTYWQRHLQLLDGR